ncbi:hypothetical protein [Dongia sp.]|uniref:hypothetical protein n=1 Tax=Dongia sp. TaxID=1977262 RepID=UPI0035B24D2C
MSFRDDLIASRRLAMLRLVKEQEGCNESVLNIGIHALGFRKTSRQETRDDLRWLEKRDLVTIEMVRDTVMVATVTDRGREAAAGRGEPVEGLERPE